MPGYKYTFKPLGQDRTGYKYTFQSLNPNEDNYLQRKKVQLGGWQWTMDKLSRGVYAGAGFADVLLDPKSKGLAEAWAEGRREFVDPQNRREFRDLIVKYLPDFAEEHPATTTIFGMMGDVVLDPLNLLFFGPIPKVARLSLTGLRHGIQAAGQAPELVRALRGGVDIGTGFGRAMTSALEEELSEGGVRFARHVIEANAEKKFASELLTARTANQMKVEQSYAKRASTLRKQHHEALARYNSRLARAVDQAQNEVLRDVVQRGVLGAEEAMALQKAFPALPGRAVDLATKTTAKRVRWSPEISRVKKASAARRAFPAVPEEAISPAYLKGPNTDEVVKLLDARAKEVTDALAPELDEIASEFATAYRSLNEQRLKALEDGIDITLEARKRARQLAYDVAPQPKAAPPTWKSVADVLTDPELLDDISKGTKFGVLSGLKSLAESSEILKRLQSIPRNPGLLQEYIAAREFYYAELLRIGPEVLARTKEIVGGISKPDAERLGRLAYRIFFKTQELKEAGTYTLGAGQKILHDLIEAEQLTPELKAALGQIYADFRQIARLDQEAHLISAVLENYVPGVYEDIHKNFLNMSRKVRMLDSVYTPGEHKVFKSLESMRHAGLRPIEDIGVMYMVRVLQHRRQFAFEHFRHRLAEMYPGWKHVSKITEKPGHFSVNATKLREEFGPLTQNKWGDWIDKTGQIVAPGERTLADIRFVGDGLYGPEGFYEANKFAQSFDRVQQYFRRVATVAKTAFGTKQVFANTGQMTLAPGKAGGLNALRIYDPRVATDTGLVMLGRAPRYLDVVDNFGRHVSGAQLQDEILQYGMMTNTAIDPAFYHGVDPSNVKKLQKLLDRERRIEKIAGDSLAKEGFYRFFSGMLKYINIPGHVEDFFRISTFLNARRLGLTASEAAKHVQNTFFNYLHGLSEIEQRWFRRVMPFYSYQRFALPLMAKSLAQTPMRLANTAKVTDHFFRIWNRIADNESLSETERRVVPGWLIDQPSAFREFNDRFQAVFTTFNNFSPLDVASTYAEVFQVGDDPLSDEGVGRVLEKVALSQMTPFFKVPLELLIGKSFFTGQKLRGEGPGGASEYVLGKGDYDPDVFMANLMAAITASTTGRADLAYAAKKMGFPLIKGEVSRKFLEFLFGWEEGIDPRTGKREVYMQPWKVHVATSFFPVLRDVFDWANDELTPTEKTVAFFTGARTYKLDLAEEQRRRVMALDKRRQQAIKRYVRDPMLQGRYEDMMTSEQTLYEYLEALADVYQEISGPVTPAQP